MKSKHIFLTIVLLVAPLSMVSASNFSPTKEVSVKGCKDLEKIYRIIEDAIYVGAPTYNQGNPLGCFRIYEGAAYKIIHLYGSKCKDAKKILVAALKKCSEDYSASDKAWIMRKAFDTILGVPTITGQ